MLIKLTDMYQGKRGKRRKKKKKREEMRSEYRQKMIAPNNQIEAPGETTLTCDFELSPPQV